MIYLQYADALEHYGRALLRRYGASGVGGEEPRDLVQGFFRQMMETDGLSKTSEIRDLDGFLHTAFWRHVRGRYRRAMAKKRRPEGGVVTLRLDSITIAARAGAMIEETASVHRAVEDALSTLHERRPKYAAIIEDMIQEDDGERVRSDLAEQLDVAAENVATLEYRARRVFEQLFLEALSLIVCDESLVHEIQRRFLPWLPLLHAEPRAA